MSRYHDPRANCHGPLAIRRRRRHCDFNSHSVAHSPRTLIRMLANNVLVFTTVYDITKRSTFANLQKWIEEVRRYTASNVLIILIGNKCDLEAEREVDFEEARQMCQYIPEILFVMETSAKENTNVEDAFRCLATELKVCCTLIHVRFINVLIVLLAAPTRCQQRAGGPGRQHRAAGPE